jgi:hypothetical protein
MTTSEEFIPMDYFSWVARWWWVAVLCAILGGFFGFLFSRLQPPVYEAQAVFTATLDYNKIDFMHFPVTTPSPYKMTQYDEDLALSVVNASLVLVIPQVVSFAQQNGINIDLPEFKILSTIERKNAFWDVRFRSNDPAVAQKIVNFWAQQGFADMQIKQNANKIPNYVLFDLVELADLPKVPAYFQTNSAVLMGGVVGLVLGFILMNFRLSRFKRDH